MSFELVPLNAPGVQARVAYPFRVMNTGPETVLRIVHLALADGRQAVLICEPTVNPGYSASAMLPELRRRLLHELQLSEDVLWFDLTQKRTSANEALMTRGKSDYLAFPVVFCCQRAVWGFKTSFNHMGLELGVHPDELETLCFPKA